jgi:hypothetical protein
MATLDDPHISIVLNGHVNEKKVSYLFIERK